MDILGASRTGVFRCYIIMVTRVADTGLCLKSVRMLGYCLVLGDAVGGRDLGGSWNVGVVE